MTEKGKFVRLSVDLTPEEYNRLKLKCDDRGMHKAEFVRRAIKEKIDRDDAFLRTIRGMPPESHVASDQA